MNKLFSRNEIWKFQYLIDNGLDETDKQIKEKKGGRGKREKKNAILISRSFCELAAKFCPLFFFLLGNDQIRKKSKISKRWFSLVDNCCSLVNRLNYTNSEDFRIICL